MQGVLPGGRNRKLLHNSFDRSSKGLQCRTAAVPTPASPAVPQPRRRDNAASLARLQSDATLPVFGPQVCMRNAQDAAGSEKGTSRKGDAAKLTN